MITYFFITTILNLISCYFIQRLWVLHFINHFPGIYNKTYKTLWAGALPIMIMSIFLPVPFMGAAVTFFIFYTDKPFYFRYQFNLS